MKNTIFISILLLAIGQFSCKKESASIETTPNYCLPNTVTVNDEVLLEYKYNADNTLPNTVTLKAESDIAAKFLFDAKNTLTGMALSDDEEATFKYDGSKISKVEIKSGGVLIGEKIVGYSGANISKIESFDIDEGVKTASMTINLNYDANNNVKKISFVIPEISKSEFLVFEGTQYNSYLSEYAALGKYNKAYLLAFSDVVPFLPSTLVASMLSKNACEKGKISFGFVEILFSLLFGNITEKEALAANVALDFSNAMKYNEKGFVSSNTITMKDNDPMISKVDFICK